MHDVTMGSDSALTKQPGEGPVQAFTLQTSRRAGK